MNKKIILGLGAATLLLANVSFAGVKNIRVVWDKSPSSEAVIGFTPVGTSTGRYVKYGTSTTESSWGTNSNVVTRIFKTSLTSSFVRLTGLGANTEYFFRACDASGCSEPYFFRTAPSGSEGLTFVAGGDSRTNQAARQQGNRIVQKVRPHFVLFSGDYTDSHTVSEMDTWLADWTLTFAPTTVNSIAYKQVFPLVPTVGNHEYSDMKFMCSVFGVDVDSNGSCTNRDTYNAFNIGSLLRVYTLNTEFGSAEANDTTAQKSWLASDLGANYTATTWRLAQYHKPMFPRTTTKPLVHQIAYDWAQNFYDYRMNLAIESDSHLVKYTKPVRPSSPDYVEVTSGTVYIGEGAWGAPTRTADRSSAWIVDQDSFAQVNVIQATTTKLDVRTVYLSSEASTTALSKAARDADRLALPTGWTLWDAASVGTVLNLKRDASGYTQLDESTGTTTTATLSATRDVSVGSGGFFSNGSTVYADGDDVGQQLRALMGWTLTGVPTTATLLSASVKINVVDPSTGVYNLYAVTGTWAETTANYANAQNVGTLMGSVTPSANGTATITLNAAGRAIVQGWLNGSTANHGVVLYSSTTNGVDFTSREGGNAPKLVVTY